jgi:hypothetical protein
MKYNCYILRIQVLKKNIGSWWGDIRARRWKFENSRETQLIKEMLKTFYLVIKLRLSSFYTIINKIWLFGTQKSSFIK